MKNKGDNKWLLIPKPNAGAALRIFCFPFAGGGAQAYSNWSNGLPDDFEVCAIQLPGRGSRLQEPLFDSWETLVNQLYQALLNYLDKPFVLFGHSMGAIISFEFARLLRRKNGLTPAHLFVSGRGGPKERDREQLLSDLPDPELITQLTKFEGLPKDPLHNSELMQIMLPTIRADFKVCETYTYLNETALDCPISAFGGLQDHDVTRDRLDEWREETKSHFSLRMFQGGHFYLHTAQAQLLQAICRDLQLFFKANS